MERNNTLPLWIGAIVLAALVGGFFYFSGSAANAEKGKVYVTVSDATADIQNVSEVAMTVDKVEVYSAAQGWVTVSSSPRTFNLLALKASGKAELAARGDIAAGSYDQVRATVSRVEVRTKNAGNKAAVVVARTITIPGTVVVEAGKSSHVDLDVQTSDSLYASAAGDYVFAPVIVYKTTHGGTVTVGADNAVTSTGGSVDTSIAVGTDLSGNIVVGSRLSPTLELSVSGTAVTAVNATGNGLVQLNASGLLGGNASAGTAGTSTSTGRSSNRSEGGGTWSASTSVRLQGAD